MSAGDIPGLGQTGVMTKGDNAAAKKGLEVFWFSTGKEDSLIDTTRSTVELLKRDYLSQFVPLFFQ